MTAPKKAARPKRKAPITVGNPVATQADMQGFYGATGYHSARVMRRIDRTTPTKAAGVRHELVSRDRLLAESRAFIRDNLLYSGLIERCIDFSIGEGFDLIAEDKTVDALWEEWYQDCEVTGRYKGGKLARAVAREYFVTGEGVLLKLAGGNNIQLIESEQIPMNSGKSRTGVETDSTGKPITFYVSGYRDGNLESPKAVKAKDVLFICERERPSSVRGVPPAQTAFPMLHRINDVCDAEALAMQLLSRIVLKHMTDTGGNFSDGGTTSSGVSVSDLPYGVVFEGSLDDELTPMERDIPGKDFPATITMFARLLGLPFGLPLELVLLDWTKSNYSQMKGALVLSDRRFQEIKELFIRDFYEPLFLWKRQQWIAEGKIKDTPETKAHQWITPDFPWVDPLQEATAQEKMVDLGLTSHGAACKRVGEERPKLLSTLKAEIIEAITIAKEIEAETGVLPPWQSLAGRSAGKTEQAVIAGKESETEGEGEEEKEEDDE